jgi:hypothetical protein
VFGDDIALSKKGLQAYRKFFASLGLRLEFPDAEGDF